MKGYKKILIAVNGSKEALLQGLKLAGDEGCWVTVVKVVPPYEGDINLVGIKNIREALDGGGEKAITEIKNIAEAERGLVKTRLEEGDIHTKIVEVAEDEKCDLIIMGKSKSKKSRFIKIFGDRILKKVISQSPCPVLVVEA